MFAMTVIQRDTGQLNYAPLLDLSINPQLNPVFLCLFFCFVLQISIPRSQNLFSQSNMNAVEIQDVYFPIGT